jgi:hypothetical protein
MDADVVKSVGWLHGADWDYRKVLFLGSPFLLVIYLQINMQKLQTIIKLA